MENVIITKFDVDSEAFQAFTMLKSDAFSYSCKVSQASLVRRESGSYRIIDQFDNGKYSDDTLKGGFLGMLIGILGGPIGVLLGGSIGFFAGGSKDSKDADRDRSMIESVIGDTGEDCMFLAVLAEETDPAMYNSKMANYGQTTTRYDANELLSEIKAMHDLEKETAKKAKEELRESKRAALREKHRGKSGEEPPRTL